MATTKKATASKSTTKKTTKAPVKKTTEKAKEPAKKTVKKTTAKVEEVKNTNKDSIAYSNVSILLAMAVEALILLLGYLIIINA